MTTEGVDLTPAEGKPIGRRIVFGMVGVGAVGVVLGKQLTSMT